MNKKIRKKLHSLSSAMQSHRGKFEEKFAPRDVAIMLFRCGVHDNDLHSIAETAKRFKLSESRINQIQGKFDRFAKTLPTSGSRVVAKGKIENGKTTIEHENGERVEKTNPIRSPFQMHQRHTNTPRNIVIEHGAKELKSGFIVDLRQDLRGAKELPNNHTIEVNVINLKQDVFHETLVRLLQKADSQRLYQKIDEVIIKTENRAGVKYLVAFFGFTVTFALMLGVKFIGLTGGKEMTALVLQLLFTTFSFYHLIDAVSLTGKRRGLIEARKNRLV